MEQTVEPAKVLTIAGSDSGGAAGLQADLKTFAALGVYGSSALTVVTAQNSRGVTAVHPLPATFVTAQLEAIFNDYGTQGAGISAVKTGFLARVDLITTVAASLRDYAMDHPRVQIVIDPVLVNFNGIPMFPDEVVAAYQELLFPLATLITPNRHEVALLTGQSAADMQSVAGLQTAVAHLQHDGTPPILGKGARDGANIVDILLADGQFTHYRAPWLDTNNRLGSGDTLSAAICAFLAQGADVPTAVAQAHRFTAVALQKAAHWQLGHGHGPLAQWLVVP